MSVNAPSLEGALAKIVGSIDDLGRPVVRIEVPNRDGFLAVIDTGFNRSLMMSTTEAAALGFVQEEKGQIVELGTTAQVMVGRAIGTIEWLDRKIQVDALISREPTGVHRPDVAQVLLGTELLRGCLLLVDFANGVVEIETQD
jgi:predicted aspartyl protease